MAWRRRGGGARGWGSRAVSTKCACPGNQYIVDGLAKHAETFPADSSLARTFRKAVRSLRGHAVPLTSGQQAITEVKGVGQYIAAHIEAVIHKRPMPKGRHGQRTSHVVASSSPPAPTPAGAAAGVAGVATASAASSSSTRATAARGVSNSSRSSGSSGSSRKARVYAPQAGKAPWVTLMALWTLAREASLSSSTSSAVQDMQFSMSQLAVRYAQVVAAGVTTMDALLKVSLFSASKKNCMRILGDAGLLQRESTTAVRLTDKGYRLGSVEAIKRRAAFLEKLAGGAGSLVGSASVPVASTQRPRERKRSRPSEGDGGGVSGGGAGGGAGATGNSSSSSSGSTLRRSHTTPAPSRRTRPRLETLAHTPTSSDHSPVHLMPRSCLRRDVMSRWRVVLLVDNREVRSRHDPDFFVAKLLERGVSAEVRKLELGDMLWVVRSRSDPDIEFVMNHLVERKNIEDLEGSMRDGRYEEQKYRLRRCGLTRIAYLVEGSPSQARMASGKSVRFAMVATQIHSRLFVYNSSSIHESVDFLADTHESILEAFQDDSAVAQSVATEHDAPLASQRDIEDLAGRAGMPTVLQSLSQFSEHAKLAAYRNVSAVFGACLRQLNNAGPLVVEAIVERFPTIPAFMTWLESFGSDKAAIKALGALKVGILNRTVGPSLAKRMYNHFMALDYATMP